MTNMRIDCIENPLDSVQEFLAICTEMLKGLFRYEECMIKGVDEFIGPVSLGPIGDPLTIRIVCALILLIHNTWLLCRRFFCLTRMVDGSLENILSFVICK